MFEVVERNIISTSDGKIIATFYGAAAERMAARVCRYLNSCL